MRLYQGIWRALLLGLALSVGKGIAAQEGPELENLGARQADVRGDWLVFSQWETFAGRDLNDDGDQLDAVLQLRHLPSGRTTNLGLAGGPATVELGRTDDERIGPFFGRWLVLYVTEEWQGQDLNGDGDLEDWPVLHVHDLSTGETRNLGLAWDHPGRLAFFGQRLVVPVNELLQGVDLNGDGLVANDPVLCVHDLTTSETVTLGSFQFYWLSQNWVVWHHGVQFRVLDLATGERRDLRLPGDSAWLDGHLLVRSVLEAPLGVDLNGDGDTNDAVAHVDDLRTGETTNIGLSAVMARFSAGRHLVMGVAEAASGEDFNGDGDATDVVAHVYDLASGETRNLGLPIVRYTFDESIGIAGNKVLLPVPERDHSRDLNGDGDLLDLVPQVYDTATGETTNLGLAGTPWLLAGGIGVWVPESAQGSDLNLDGDRDDTVVHAHDFATGETRNLGLAAFDEYRPPFAANRFAFRVSERGQRRDLNGDRDQGDAVVHVYDLASGAAENLRLAGADPVVLTGEWLVLEVSEVINARDLNGDRDREDPQVVHVHELASGETMNLKLDGGVDKFSGDRMLVSVLAADGSGRVYHFVDLRPEPPGRPRFLRGDCDGDGRVGGQVTDAVFLLGYNFFGREAPPCLAACDANGDGRVEGQVTDAVYLLAHSFLGGPPPVAPFPDCGPGLLETDETLNCGSTPQNCR